jgi:GABA(A) receptor-associated protein
MSFLNLINNLLDSNTNNIYKHEHSIYERVNESNYILTKYPDKIPIICEKANKNYNIPNIDKKKYLVPYNLTIGQFLYIIRKRIKISSTIALFLYINGTIPSSSESLYTIYNKYRNLDGFLYILYGEENTFG